MKIVRRILMILLMINFFEGVKNGMGPADLAIIVENGLLVILVTMFEKN